MNINHHHQRPQRRLLLPRHDPRRRRERCSVLPHRSRLRCPVSQDHCARKPSKGRGPAVARTLFVLLVGGELFAKKNSHLLHPQSKGLTEEDLSHSGFTRVTHFRPGFLETEHDRPTPRFIEGIALSIIRGLGLSSLSNPVATVGRAMINVSDGTASFIQYNRNDAGTEIAFVGNGQIKDIGRALGGEKVAETEALAPGNFRDMFLHLAIVDRFLQHMSTTYAGNKCKKFSTKPPIKLVPE
ncbi:hypothetical protein BC938DRAFT_481483 [Jimgerdemannia flammicorona]|uniref:Uncharacterized protein n=1 Tax=Jimgerdemannia flammicorona TaxID=994334 RepID=A0A433QG08_9FUNG|nr:hypothetical protein BC938DRAFT_481483 [Jimgerdemannia flammicorona]